MNMFEDGNEMSINYEKLIESDSYLDTTKTLAKKLMKSSYITVEQFLGYLKDDEITTLLECADSGEDEDDVMHDEMQDLILIAEMLAVAEGLDNSNSYEGVQQRVSQLIAFLAVESLSRKGLVKAYRKNMSFGEDMAKKIIAERIEDE